MSTDSSPISPRLLRRLAEVADEQRTGKPVYLVASDSEQIVDIPVFDSRERAEEKRAELGENFRVFGPYVTPRDPITSKIKSIQITFSVDGTDETFEVDPAEVDSIFWSMSAMEKFVFPYYTRIYGLDAATELRRACQGGDHACCGHMRSLLVPLPRRGAQSPPL